MSSLQIFLLIDCNLKTNDGLDGSFAVFFR